MTTSAAGEVNTFFPSSAESVPNAMPLPATQVPAASDILAKKIKLHLSQALKALLTKRPAVFLDRFGTLYRETKKSTHWQQTEQMFQSYKVTQDLILFEKCSELTSLQRQEFKELAELRELCVCIKELAGSELECTDREIRHQIKLAIQNLRDQVVSNGFSELLPGLGQFYALHNRQGSSINEWFAGSDIFFVDMQASDNETCFETVLVEELPSITFPSAWDLAQHRLGRPVKIFSVNLKYELNLLGYQVETFPAHSDPTIRVAVFKSLHGPSERPIFHYLSDGMRSLATAENTYGCECLFQLIGGSDPNDEESLDVPSGTARAFTLAWILLQGSKGRVLNGVAGMSSDCELFSFRPSKMNSILVTPSEDFPLQYKARDRAFRVCNIVSLYEDEAELLTQGKELLIRLLKHRYLDKISNPARPSLLARSNYSILHQSLSEQVEAA